MLDSKFNFDCGRFDFPKIANLHLINSKTIHTKTNFSSSQHKNESYIKYL
jgi:hypothetical protein